MPKDWYLAALIALVAWAAIILWGASKLPWDPALVGFIGTALTLLPTAIDNLRRLYLVTKSASPPSEPGQAQVASAFDSMLGRAFRGFDPFSAICFLLGLSGIAFAFARQYFVG